MKKLYSLIIIFLMLLFLPGIVDAQIPGSVRQPSIYGTSTSSPGGWVGTATSNLDMDTFDISDVGDISSVGNSTKIEIEDDWGTDEIIFYLPDTSAGQGFGVKSENSTGTQYSFGILNDAGTLVQGWEFSNAGTAYFNLSSGRSYTVTTTSFYPESNGTIDLGTAGNHWEELFTDDITLDGQIMGVAEFTTGQPIFWIRDTTGDAGPVIGCGSSVNCDRVYFGLHNTATTPNEVYTGVQYFTTLAQFIFGTSVAMNMTADAFYPQTNNADELGLSTNLFEKVWSNAYEGASSYEDDTTQYAFESFCGGSETSGDIGTWGWASNGDGGVQDNFGPIDNASCTYRINTGTVDDGGQQLLIVPEFKFSEPVKLKWRVKPNTITGVKYFYGIASSVVEDNLGTDFIGIKFDTDASDTNWECTRANATTPTDVDSAVAPVADTWFTLETTFDGTNWHWFIDGTEVCGSGVSSTIPDAGVSTAYIKSQITTRDTTDSTFDLDFVKFLFTDLTQ